ncbi:MAG: GNAT family N-acetyltransferase [Steroidobacteraceae bacterium]
MRPARFDVLCRYFEYSLQEADRIGRCAVHDDPALGAAPWILPRSAEIEERETAAKSRYVNELLGPRGWANYRQIIDFMSQQSQGLVAGDAWYLSIIGVHPAAQGKGIGLKLLARTLAAADEVGAYAFLETFAKRGVNFHSTVRLQFSGRDRRAYDRIAVFAHGSRTSTRNLPAALRRSHRNGPMRNPDSGLGTTPENHARSEAVHRQRTVFVTGTVEADIRKIRPAAGHGSESLFCAGA